MNTTENTKKDEGLIGNEKIEEAIAALQQEPSEEMLAHALTVIRRRMREQGQVILAVDMPQDQSGMPQMMANPAAPMQIQAVQTADGKAWWVAFTSFEEELRGADQVKSTFLADLEQIFRTALTVNEIEGVILNPWNRTMMLNKNLIQIVLGDS
ncbi:SseB family protein [Clostridium sp. AF32-12BH]|uniref:SseB family protein n=1 Tax=Clostridium sp. AF32-12BH TaxID=2292006 RepID=UPI000E4C1EC1|nr:SseB family protein [Clostridium sp. AF32-12BH]RHP44026.1 SseB family protein [Clostridium sp. AF32-12BH]